MTITLLAPDGVPVTAQQERQARAAQHGGGSGRRLGGRSGFRVDTPSNILTATSTTWTLGPCAAMIDPGMTTHQGMYGWSSDANITGSMTPADANNPRKDVLFIQVNDDTAGDGSGLVSANVVYLAGNPSSTPTAPYADGFLVGTISVPVLGGGSPTVELNTARYAAAGAPLPVYSLAERDAIPDKYNGLIVQRRDLDGRPSETWDGTAWRGSTLRHAEYVNNGAWSVTGSAVWDIGPLTISSPVFNNTFSTAEGTLAGQIKITETGIYAVHIRVIPNANPGYSYLKILGNNLNPLAESDRPSGGLYELDVNRANIYLSAGDTVRGRYMATNSCNIAARMTITKIQG